MQPARERHDTLNPGESPPSKRVDHSKASMTTVEPHRTTYAPIPRMECQLRRGGRGRISRQRCKSNTLGDYSTPVHQGSRRLDVRSHPNRPLTVTEDEDILLGL